MCTHKTKKVAILKKFSVLITLSMFLSLVVMHVTDVGAVELPSTEEEGLAFLRDVARLDINKYTIGTSVIGDAKLGMQTIIYTLMSEGSRLSILHNVEKGYVFFDISSESLGAPLFAETEPTVVEEAKAILERYETNYDISYLQGMRSSLDMFKIFGNSLMNVTRKIGDINMEVSVMVYEGLGRIEQIIWSRTVNGIYNRHDIVSLRFKDGVLTEFCDSWNRYEIGSASVNVNEEQAISIAKEEAQKTWWTSGNITVSNVKVVDESILTELYFAPREEKLYPFWVIRMGLDKVYAGEVTSITVVIRADTGKPDGTSVGSGYGDPTDVTDDPSQQSPSDPSTQQDILLSLIAAVSIISVSAVIATLFVNKRRKGKLER
jgi:hypothetical protein